jgi:hypothetical protein
MGLVTTAVDHIVITEPKRITSHSSLSEIVKAFEAPPVKETRMKPVSNWEKRIWTNYHVSRMKAAVEKYTHKPDMDLTLRAGERIVVYTAMWIFLLFLALFL